MEPLLFSQSPYREFRQRTRTFVQDNITPYSLDWEQQRHFPDHLLTLCAHHDLVGLSLAPEYGGHGKEYWYEIILAEELARCRTIGWALTLFVHNNLALPLLAHLIENDIHRTVVLNAAAGKYFLALALTEPNAGSDILATETLARRVGDEYELTGEKIFITNGSVASYIIVLARLEGTTGLNGLSLFLVPADSEGVRRERLPTVGFKTGDTARLAFQQCRIPASSILSDPGRGFLHVLRALQRERLTAATGINALSLMVLEETIAMVRKRKRFGVPLAKKQVIRHRLASLRAELEGNRQLAYNTCAAYSAGQSVDQEILMLKICAYRTAQKIIRECLHLHGGEGFLAHHWLAHLYHDSQAFTIAAGTTEIMRDMLASSLRL